MTRNNPNTHALPLPITQVTLQAADRFARLQPTPQKAAQVRLNTIAVAVVNDYLQMMGIATDLRASDSWNPVMQLCADVADLEVTGAGRLECRPVLAGSDCIVPPEVWQDRIGYVVVAIDETTREANLLGFAEQAAETLSLSQLQSPEALLEQLARQLHPAAIAQGSGLVTHLRQWLQNQVEAGWQSVESLLQPAEFAYGFRGVGTASPENTIRRAKLIDLAIRLPNPVALIVGLEPSMQPSQPTHICLQVHPTQQAYLPANLRLTVLDGAGNPFLEAESRGADNYIQLQFSGVPGEQFVVQVAIGDACVVEQFVI
ncbi:DUF1822 family protein [Phormidium tenue FACHB-886]|nr:DUF1822 family protein [Phormidium tenue FACHB-886]